MRSLVVAAFAALFFSSAWGQQTGPKIPTPADQQSPAPIDAPATPGQAAAAPVLTRADVEAWLDGFMPYALQRGDIAGAVVVVVKDGAILLQKGYGFADVEARKPVDPELTLFRPGSVSKLFTWTAVMQLVEQGKIDLDEDVNRYLDFEIPGRDGPPITMRNILTHTPGFEEQAKGLMGTEEIQVANLEEHMKRWVPERVYPPGGTPAYSNYATALAGYIVARVSGMTFDDYLDEHIFKPLGMDHSTFRQPLPERLKEHMSKGYALASQPDKPFEIVGPAPAGSLSAPGADMGRFMIAHLNKGEYNGQRILQEATAKQMHETALTVIPPLNRMMLGFYETNYNDRRSIAHGGDTQWFHSYLHIFPDDNIGLYVSTNSLGKEGASQAIRGALFEQFTDRYLPGDTTYGEVDEATAKEHAAMMVGAYDNSRRMHSSFFSLLDLIGQVKISVNEDGSLGVSMMQNLAGVPMKWREVEPFVWREVGGKRRLAAKVDDGRVTRFSFDDVSPFMVFEPSPAWKSGVWLAPLLGAGLLMLLLSTLAWPTAALIRRHYRAPYPYSGDDAKRHRYVRIAALAVVALFTAWATTVLSMLSNLNLLTPSADWWLWTLQILSLFVFIGAAAIGVWNAWHVLKSNRRWYAKAWAVILALSFVVALWVALTHKLIAFDVNY